MAKFTGTVKYFHGSKGYGFIERADNSARSRTTTAGPLSWRTKPSVWRLKEEPVAGCVMIGRLLVVVTTQRAGGRGRADGGPGTRR